MREMTLKEAMKIAYGVQEGKRYTEFSKQKAASVLLNEHKKRIDAINDQLRTCTLITDLVNEVLE